MSTPVKVTEFGESGVVVEVYHKYSEGAKKVFFDIICATESVEGTARYLSPFTRIQNIPYMVISVVEAMTYISGRHKEMRDSQGEVGALPIADKGCCGLLELDPVKVMKEITSLKEFSRGSVVAEVVSTEEGEITAFSVCCWREYVGAGGERKREFYIQQRDLRDLIVVLLKAWMYVHENWGADSPVHSRRW